MKILAVETATEVCGVALAGSDSTIITVEDRIPREHARSLPIFYDELKQKTGFKLDELSGIAVSNGPGSFTGLRIGLSFGKGLAYSHDLPIIPVPTLESMALSVESDIDYSIILFSHRDMVYHQSFSSDNSSIDEAHVSRWSDLEGAMKNKRIYHTNCNKILGERDNVFEISASVKNVCSLALKHFKKWVENDPYSLVPNYIAPFEMNTP